MANFEDTISELVDAAGEKGETVGEDTEPASAGCFSDVPPINPINQIILSVFGENYFPPYSVQFQPEKKAKLTNEKLLQMQLPGGGKIKPIGTPLHNSIADYITPVSGLLGSIFNFFGPLFIILDVIRALVDIICSFFNPIPAISAIVELFITVLPPVIALYPPLSSILLALNTVKLILSIVAAMISHLIPIIEKIVLNALSIPVELARGNFKVIDSITIKICTLITHLENEIGSLAPIKFIIELLTLFISLGAKFFCVKGFTFGEEDSPCCSEETCPPILINPPAGRAIVLRDQNRFSLLTLINLGFAAVYPITKIISDTIDIVLTYLTDILEPYIQIAIDSTVGVINSVTSEADAAFLAIENVIKGMLDLINTVTGTAFATIIEQFKEEVDIPFTSDDLQIEPINFDFGDIQIPAPKNLTEALESLPLFAEALSLIGLVPKTISDIFDSIVFVPAQTEIKMLRTNGNNVVSQANTNGLSSEFGVGHIYSYGNLIKLQEYIIDPRKIPASQVQNDPATLRCRVRKANPTVPGEEVFTTCAVMIPPKNFLNEFIVTGDPLSLLPFFGSDTYPADQLVLSTDAFKVGDEIEFYIEPDFVALLSLNLIGFGCHPDIQSAAQGLVQFINADVDAAAATGGSGNDTPGAGADEGFTGFDPLIDKIGREFPQPPLDQLASCIALQAADPSINQSQCFIDVLGDYIQDLSDFYDAVLCVGVSRIQSPYNASKKYAIADGEDFVNITLGVRDTGGNNLLLGAIPTSSFRAQFSTTLGTLGPIIFDVETGEFRTTLTSTKTGLAEISAAFIVNDKVCMRPGQFDGFVVTDKNLFVDFIPEAGTFPRRRPDKPYIQSRGGRRR